MTFIFGVRTLHITPRVFQTFLTREAMKLSVVPPTNKLFTKPWTQLDENEH